ncbi:FGGY family carbohydrate kinase [Methylopila sp. Yamaguchi]|uniref:FGGY family carbohydrate kinase n=1 Tax=Methylopila sp. Yamaguchi TaxID=1437817 RepID=UPI000CB163C6|nr:FGGY family carbohydrate kinase [Methylopila sp. Yamaguchi]GBD46919.1 glycerol kinase [Methylopila sp. Yamaguchi]
MRIAAIDQGTTSTRALVVDASDGTAVIAHAVRHAQSHPAPGWVEHDAEELLANVRACVAAAGPVDALALANQGESCLAWDALTGEALSPVIVWQDNRTADAIAGLADHAALVETRAGLPLDAYFSASKLGWLLRHLPRVQAARNAGRLRLGTTDAFFLDRLAGLFATDAATASRTSLMGLATGRWDPELCALFGVPLDCLPEIRPTVGGFGRIEGVPVVASVVDQQAALYGHGCRAPGDAKITFGTGAFALAVTGGEIVRAAGEGLLPTVAWAIGKATTYAVDGGVYDAGSAVEWAMRIGIVDDVSQLDGFAEPPAIDRGLVFVPALSGLACPHWDRSAAALFLGMSAATTRADLRQALLEGIALRTAEVVATIGARVPLAPAISIDGGLSRSGYFAQFLADSLGREVVVGAFDERTAFGAAALAASAFGIDLAVPAEARRHALRGSETREARRARFAEAVARTRGWRAV